MGEEQEENIDDLEKFGEYDECLDLSCYQHPTLDKFPKEIQRILIELRDSDTYYILPLLLSAGDRTVIREMYQQPNVLLAGTIASGKTQFVYNQLAIWIARNHPAELRLVICRSKPVDYNAVAKLEKHFLAKPPRAKSAIAEDHEASATIEGVLDECNARLLLFKNAGVKTIEDYNAKFINRKLDPYMGHRYLPSMVLVMDDMQTFLNGRTTELLSNLTQINLYTGIYVLAVTSQIMSRSITPQLRANFGTRIGMKLMSQNESRKILDRVGAEKLIYPGELVYEQGDRILKGIQPYMDHSYMHALCDFISPQKGYPTAYLLPESNYYAPDTTWLDVNDRDELFEEAARLIVMHQQGSATLIQRKLKLGYNRANRIIDQLEGAGIVGPFEGSKARDVLYPDEYSLEQYLATLFDRESPISPTPAANKPATKGKLNSLGNGKQKASKNKWWIIVVIIAVLWYWFSRG